MNVTTPQGALGGGGPQVSGHPQGSGGPLLISSVEEFERLAITAVTSINQAERRQAEHLLLSQTQSQNPEVWNLCLCVLERGTNPAALPVAVIVLRNTVMSQWSRRQLSYEAHQANRIKAPTASGPSLTGSAEEEEQRRQLEECENRVVQLIRSMSRILQAHALLYETNPLQAAEFRVADRQMMYAVALLVKKGLASGLKSTKETLFQMLISFLEELYSLAFSIARSGSATAFSLAPPPTLLGLNLALCQLTEISKEIVSTHLSFLQLTTQQHVDCKKAYETRVFLPLVDASFSLLNFLVNAPPAVSTPPSGLQRSPQHTLLVTITGVLELLMDWNFGHALLRFITTSSDVSFAPPSEWISVFFPSSSSSTSSVTPSGTSSSSSSLPLPSSLPVLPGQSCRPNLFALCLSLYRYVSLQRDHDAALFKTARLILIRLAKFRAHRMADALFGGMSSSSSNSSNLSSLAMTKKPGGGGGGMSSPLSRSYSGPIGRMKKQQITGLVYVPLLDVILDLLDQSAFMKSSTASIDINLINSATDVLSVYLPIVGGDGRSQSTNSTNQHTGGGYVELTEDDVENLEEVQDLCYALFNLSECNEAIAEYLFDGTAGKALPLFVRLSAALMGVVLRSDAAAKRLGNDGLAAEEGVETAIGALEFLLRAWSTWADRIHQQLLVLQGKSQSNGGGGNGSSLPGVSQESNPQGGQVLSSNITGTGGGAGEESLSQRSWRSPLEQSIHFLIRIFVTQGLSICSHRESSTSMPVSNPEGHLSATAGGGPGISSSGVPSTAGAGGSLLDDFLRSFAILGRCIMPQTLEQVLEKSQQLRQEVWNRRRACAEGGGRQGGLMSTAGRGGEQGAGGGGAGGGNSQLVAEDDEQLLDELNFLFLFIQQLIVIPVSGTSKTSQKLSPPAQVLRNEVSQALVVRVVGQVFGILQEERDVLKEQEVRSLPPGFISVSPVILQHGIDILSCVSGAYLLRSRYATQPMLAEFAAPEKGQQALNGFVQLVAELLHLLPHEEALSLSCVRTLEVLAASDNPTNAYLWESAAYQALLEAATESCSSFLLLLKQHMTQQASGRDSSSSSSEARNSSATASSASRAAGGRPKYLPLQQLTQRTVSRLYSAFSASTSMSDHIWGLAKIHVAEQMLQRSGTLLAHEVVRTRQERLVAMCVPIEDVLKLLANHPVETHPLVFHALGNCLAMGIGLLEGCPQESVAVWSLWLQESIQYVVAVALKYIAYPHILHKAVKFFLRFLKKAYSCFTEAAAWSFIERYKSLIEQMANHYAKAFVGAEEEENIFSNFKQISKCMRVLMTSSRDTPSFTWTVGVFVECLQSMRPLIEKLRPRDYPKVAAPLLGSIQVSVEGNTRAFLARLSSPDISILLARIGDSLLVEMGRVRQPAYEILHCICRCLVVVQLEQQRGTNTTGGDEKEKASLGEVYVHLSNLPIRLLGYALSNPMTSNADLDFLSDCVFDLFFMIGIRANALQEFLSNFIRLYAVLTLQHQQGLVGGPAGPQAGNPSSSSSLFLSGDKGSHTASSLPNQGSVLDASMNGCLTSSSSSTGGTSGVPPPELVEARLTVLLQAVLQSIQHFTGTGDNALSGETNVPPGGAGSMMAAGGELIGYSKQQQAFRDVFKYFVVECSSPVASLLSGEGGGARGVKKAF